MDSIDKGILKDLEVNCRTTYQDLARRYGISANAIRKRVLRLEETKAIIGYSVTMSPAMFDSEYLWGTIHTDGSWDEEEFVEMIGSHPNVTAAASYTAGIFVLIAEYTNAGEMLDVGNHLRSLDAVKSVKTQPFLSTKGGRMEVSNLHLRVLKSLRDDPKKSIVDISADTGLTARRTRKLLDELLESKSFACKALVKLGAAGNVPFLARMSWDQSMTDYQTVADWLKEEYSPSLWQMYIIATEPTIITLHSTDELYELDRIVRSIRAQPFIKNVITLVSIHHKYFPSIRVHRLDEMIEERLGE